MSKTYDDAYPHLIRFSNSIPTEYNTQFKQLVLKKYNQICPEYLRHKTAIMSPEVISCHPLQYDDPIPWTVHGYLPRRSSRGIQLWR